MKKPKLKIEESIIKVKSDQLIGIEFFAGLIVTELFVIIMLLVFK